MPGTRQSPYGLPPHTPSPAAARLDQELRRAADQGRPLLGGYLLAGWPPDPGRRATACRVLADSADFVEIGLPARSPYLAGKTLAAAHSEVLADGGGPGCAIDLAAALAARGTLVVVTAYWHTLAGEPGIAADLAAAGAAGVIVPDLPVTRASSWSASAAAAGLHTILPADSIDPGDLIVTARYATGAIYLPAASGITGTDALIRDDLARDITLVKRFTRLPAVTGTGITTPGRAATAATCGAAAVIAGSAFTRAAGSDDPATEIRDLANRFSSAIDAAVMSASGSGSPVPRRDVAGRQGRRPPRRGYPGRARVNPQPAGGEAGGSRRP